MLSIIVINAISITTAQCTLPLLTSIQPIKYIREHLFTTSQQCAKEEGCCNYVTLRQKEGVCSTINIDMLLFISKEHVNALAIAATDN